MKPCGIAGCEREMYLKGMCGAHYQQVRRAVSGRAPQPKHSPEEKAWLGMWPNGISPRDYPQALAMVKRLQVRIEAAAPPPAPPKVVKPNKRAERAATVDSGVRQLLEGGPATSRELMEAVGATHGEVLGALRRLGAVRHGEAPAFSPHGAACAPAIVWALPQAGHGNGATSAQQHSAS